MTDTYQLVKRSYDLLPYTLDFSGQMEADDTISAASVAMADADSGVTVGNVTTGDQSVSFTLAGGTAGRYRVRVRATFGSSPEYQIEELVPLRVW